MALQGQERRPAGVATAQGNCLHVSGPGGVRGRLVFLGFRQTQGLLGGKRVRQHLLVPALSKRLSYRLPGSRAGWGLDLPAFFPRTWHQGCSITCAPPCRSRPRLAGVDVPSSAPAPPASLATQAADRALLPVPPPHPCGLRGGYWTLPTQTSSPWQHTGLLGSKHLRLGFAAQTLRHAADCG